MTTDPLLRPAEPGEQVRIEMTKWGDRPHWVFDGVVLGEDALGTWIGYPVGTPHVRPGASFVSTVPAVTLVPRDAWWLATLHRPGTWLDVYVDVATPARWERREHGLRVSSVDLDLDVVRLTGGRVYVDDQDEFAEHQVTLGYPPAVVTAAEAACAEVLADVQAGRAPYDGSAEVWFSRLDPLTRRA